MLAPKKNAGRLFRSSQPAVVLARTASVPKRDPYYADSRRLASIILRQVSFRVDKFSAEHDLVDSCSFTGAANNRCTLRTSALDWSPPSRTSFGSRTNWIEFEQDRVWHFTTGPSAPNPMETKKGTRLRCRALTRVNGWCSNIEVQFST
jgi:hypothetical protein